MIRLAITAGVGAGLQKHFPDRGAGGGGSRGAGSFEARRRGAPGHEAMGSGSVTALEEFKFYLFR